MTTRHDFWSGHDDPARRRRVAAELLLDLPRRAASVLELGCGRGALHPYLRHRCLRYVGVDRCAARLDAFRAHWPDVELIQADAAALPPIGGRFDVVVVNDLVRRLEPDALPRLLRRLRTNLATDARVILTNVPDRHLRLIHHAGGLRDRGRLRWRRLLAYACARARGRADTVGHWYTRHAIAAAADELGYDATTSSSASRPHCFHAVLMPRRAARIIETKDVAFAPSALVTPSVSAPAPRPVRGVAS